MKQQSATEQVVSREIAKVQTLREVLLHPIKQTIQEKPTVKQSVPVVVKEREVPKVVHKKPVTQPAKVEQKIHMQPIPVAEKRPVVEIAPQIVIEEKVVVPASEMSEIISMESEQPPTTELVPEDNLEKPDTVLLQSELPFLVFEVSEDEKNPDAELVLAQPLSEQLYERIQTLEPIKVEEATAILEVISEKITELYELELTEENTEQVQQQLEILCTRMLVCMDIEPTPEVVKQLILALRQEYIEQVQEEVSLEDEGTHERKHNLGQLIHDIQDLMHPLSQPLGRYALQATVA